jgi:hypothetical protein
MMVMVMVMLLLVVVVTQRGQTCQVFLGACQLHSPYLA